MRTKMAIKNVFFSLLLQLVSIICGLIVPKMIITHYGSATNGLIVSITQFLAYIALLESGIGPVVKAKLYKPIAEKKKQEIENILFASERFFKWIAKIFLIYVFALCIFYPLIVASQFEKGFTISLIVILSLSTLVEYYFGITYKLYLQAEQKTYITSYFQIVSTILNTIGVCILVFLGANLLFVKILSTVFFIIRPLLQNYYVKKRFNLHLQNANKKYILEQKWDGLAQHIAAVIHGNTDITILTLFATISEVSIYSIYLLVINGVKRVISSFTGGIDASFGNMIAREELTTLNKSFNGYEFLYFTLITIIYSCTFLLIVPFVKIYTFGIKDANYVRPLFAILIVFSEFMHSIRLPYSSLVMASGHFKETRRGAWLESIINIILSLLFVFQFGLIGVAIGTLCAMTIRTIEFVKHTSYFILKRNIKESVKKIGLCLMETLVIVSIFWYIPIKIYNYFSWISYASFVFLFSSLFVFFINRFIFKDSYRYIKSTLKKLKK